MPYNHPVPYAPIALSMLPRVAAGRRFAKECYETHAAVNKLWTFNHLREG